MRKIATLITIVFLFTILFNNFALVIASYAQDESMQEKEVIDDINLEEQEKIEDEEENIDIEETDNLEDKNELTQNNVEENDTNKQESSIETENKTMNKVKAKISTKTIEDGIYEIETALDSNKVLDVLDASKISGANVQIFTRNNAECQKVQVKYCEDGYYTLTFLHSNMLLDVSNANTANHTNVWQCRPNGADAQKWAIEDLGDGHYHLISKISNTYLTVAGGKTANATNIEIDAENGGPSQKFKFNKIEPVKGTKTIENGIYEIETALDSNKVLDVLDASKISGANVQIFTRNNAHCQKVEVKYQGNGYYTLAFIHSNMLLDVSNGNIVNHTNVWQCRPNGADAQKWVIKDAGNGYYNIISKRSNTYLTVAEGKTANCTNIEIDTYNGGVSQKFKFNNLAPTKATQTIKDGIYEIETGVDSNKALDVVNASMISGGNVRIYDKNKEDCQRVKVKYMGDGYYTLTFEHSKMLLDVSNGKIENHTNVWQCRPNGADAQKWVIKDAGDGYYYIISKQSNTYLTVSGGNVEISTKIEGLSQKFKFNDVSKIYGTQTIEDGIYEIETGVDSSKALDVLDASMISGANVQIYPKNQAKCQQVNVKYVGSGYYTLTFVHSNMLLDVSNGRVENHTNVWQCRENGADAQKWIIKEAGNGYYYIISKQSNTYLTVEGGKTANCTNIEIDEKNGTMAQKFRFNKFDETYGERTIANGVYEIETALDSNKVLDVLDASTISGGNVQLYTRNNANCQKVRVRYLGNGGYYSLTFIHSEMLLDVSNGETANHTNVWQCRENGADAQKWIIKDAGNGYYNIISKHSKTYLTVAGGNTANCTNIEIDARNGGASQKFKFNPTRAIYPNYSNFEQLDEARYPGYKARLRQLQSKYPNWTIKIKYTGLDWNTVIDNQYGFSSSGSPRSLTQSPWLNEWKSSEDDNKYDVSQTWYRASKKGIAYMMDPRNSLEEEWIFQFQNLGSSSGTYEDIYKMVEGTFLDTDSCIKAILQVAKEQNISPFHIASRILHEQGSDGRGVMNGYTYMGRKVYNLYNIAVTGNTQAGIVAGAKYAYERQWFTPEASIKGGAEFLSKNYIAKGQSTLYFQKYNVINSPLYEHQYMQNIRAANDEGNRVYKSYRASNLLDSRFEFTIPVFENMPVEDAPVPRR